MKFRESPLPQPSFLHGWLLSEVDDRLWFRYPGQAVAAGVLALVSTRRRSANGSFRKLDETPREQHEFAYLAAYVVSLCWWHLDVDLHGTVGPPPDPGQATPDFGQRVLSELVRFDWSIEDLHRCFDSIIDEFRLRLSYGALPAAYQLAGERLCNARGDEFLWDWSAPLQDLDEVISSANAPAPPPLDVAVSSWGSAAK